VILGEHSFRGGVAAVPTKHLKKDAPIYRRASLRRRTHASWYWAWRKKRDSGHARRSVRRLEPLDHLDHPHKPRRHVEIVGEHGERIFEIVGVEKPALARKPTQPSSGRARLNSGWKKS
jgi:hypothetical protein